MKARICPRKWQVEAVRDGRVTGKDLERALRHQATCAECAEEVRQLARLGEHVAHLPELARDPLTTRRARQRLIAALNESLIEPLPRRLGGRAAFGFGVGIAAVALVWFAFKRPSASPSPHADGASVIEVHAAPGARWSEHVARDLDRIDLVDGTASFKVHPHAGRHVVIGLPDGELEDLGTVFEIFVAAQHTQRISVSEGRVSVRLLGRPSFSLGARETWDSEAPQASGSTTPEAAKVSLPSVNPEPSTSPDAARSAGATPVAAASGKSAATPTRTRVVSSNEPSTASPSPPASAEPAAPNAESAKAEDDAYLRIVELLKQAKYAQARGEAKQYLLRFPSGFRRIEVLNIATHAIVDDGADAGH